MSSIAAMIVAPFVLIFAAAGVDALAGAPRKPIQRVAIIGSGIAGLTTAHALGGAADDDLQVSVFDARPRLDYRAGAGVQINSGLAVLRAISPELSKAVIRAGTRLDRVQSRCKPWKRNGGGEEVTSSPLETDEFDKLLELNLKQIVQSAGGKVAESLLVSDDEELLWTSIMRGALQEALCSALPYEVQFSKQLTGLEPCVWDRGATCQFADGTTAGPFDLIVGCDGIKSAVKEYVDKGKISADESSRQGAAAGLYTGIRIRYAVQDGEQEDDDDSTISEPTTFRQFFGDGAYCLQGVFGAGPNRPNTKAAFITYLDPDYLGPFRRPRQSTKAEAGAEEGSSEEEAAIEDFGENADWTQNVQTPLDISRQTMLLQLEEAGIDAVDLRSVVQAADRFFELGVYAHNPFCRWSRRIKKSAGDNNNKEPVSSSSSAFAVLCGDAAHALPPFLGQGANQAIQDAYCLASKVRAYNQDVLNPPPPMTVVNKETFEVEEVQPEPLELQQALKDYERIRWPATFQIFWKASFLGYLETGGTNGLYSKFRDLFFKIMGILGVAQWVLLSAATPTVE